MKGLVHFIIHYTRRRAALKFHYDPKAFPSYLVIYLCIILYVLHSLNIVALLELLIIKLYRKHTCNLIFDMWNTVTIEYYYIMYLGES